MKITDQKIILSNLGIDALNEMQHKALRLISKEQDILLISPTGSGKTIAYLLPILQLLDPGIKTVQALVVVPSRELAQQIEQVWKQMKTGYKVNACYGGHSIDVELKNLSNPPALLVGTPGRLKDHLERHSFDPDSINTLVLDEFDKSLELGFQEVMEHIIARLSCLKKRVLTSATTAIEIPEFVHIDSPVVLNYSEREKTNTLSIKRVLSPEKDKIETLFHLCCMIASEQALIFCNHRESVERVCTQLEDKGIQAGCYHGGMDQDDRERQLIRFRNGSLNYLVTTDLGARGLDIPEMKHVIHYHLPSKETEFTHRNGRTARMHASGTVYVILSQGENVPEYIPENIEILPVKTNMPLPSQPEYQTIYISGGKKNKLSKVDIVGFFLQKGKMEKTDLGLIEVKDFISFVAVRSSAVKSLLKNIGEEKLKGKKYKIEVARSIVR